MEMLRSMRIKNEELNGRWHFTAEQLANSPSHRGGIKACDETFNRQSTALLIKDIAEYLRLTKICKVHAYVYMQRFYTFHSFKDIKGDEIAPVCVFLAAKMQDQPRTIKEVIFAAAHCLQKGQINESSVFYLRNLHDITLYENLMLQTFSFQLVVAFPQVHVLKGCDIIEVCKDIKRIAYFFVNKCLIITNMHLKYRAPLIACFCIELVCRWENLKLSKSTEGLPWFYYLDQAMTSDLMEAMMQEFCTTLANTSVHILKRLNLENVNLNPQPGNLLIYTPKKQQQNEIVLKKPRLDATVANRAEPEVDWYQVHLEEEAKRIY